ncbi:hypothetical protein SAMN02787142_0576 [Burkholderia sp. WP9]|uniref:hypothetical protein n=1 Tax=Burkholderia sp. WP9 TaxID=1500263 RepID=UPI00089AAC6B|nr:hypothetical protein [Burkholderia sp. WP9]SEB92769.1 hypothetical protein SAMN02787142_0576 [Burkholderia sp. WP9]
MNFEQLQQDFTAATLEQYVRFWHAQSDRKDTPLETLIRDYASTDYSAFDLILCMLSEAWGDIDYPEDDIVAVTFAEFAKWDPDYSSYFGCRVIEWERTGNREVQWGHGDEYLWSTVEDVIKAVSREDEAPDWWDDSWTDYECWDWRGQNFLKLEDLPACDPRHPDFVEEETEA